jgi:hypothetical protein
MNADSKVGAKRTQRAATPTARPAIKEIIRKSILPSLIQLPLPNSLGGRPKKRHQNVVKSEDSVSVANQNVQFREYALVLQ